MMIQDGRYSELAQRHPQNVRNVSHVTRILFIKLRGTYDHNLP